MVSSVQMLTALLMAASTSTSAVPCFLWHKSSTWTIFKYPGYGASATATLNGYDLSVAFDLGGTISDFPDTTRDANNSDWGATGLSGTNSAIGVSAGHSGWTVTVSGGDGSTLEGLILGYLDAIPEKEFQMTFETYASAPNTGTPQRQQQVMTSVLGGYDVSYGTALTTFGDGRSITQKTDVMVVMSQPVQRLEMATDGAGSPFGLALAQKEPCPTPAPIVPETTKDTQPKCVQLSKSLLDTIRMDGYKLKPSNCSATMMN